MARLIGGEDILDTKRVSRSYHLNGRHGATAASPAAGLKLTDGLGQR
jgi:hypothetical protein